MKITEGSCVERTQRKRVSIKSRLKVIWIICQRKVFCGQRIPEPSCERKETVDLEKTTEKSCNLFE